MYIRSDITIVQGNEMHYVNAWLKKCVFNLDLNQEIVSEPQTLSGRLFQILAAKCENAVVVVVVVVLYLSPWGNSVSVSFNMRFTNNRKIKTYQQKHKMC